MTGLSAARLPLIVFGLWLSLVWAASPLRAQQSPVPASEADVNASPELAEIERKVQEARARLADWRRQGAEYVLSAEEAQARTRVIDEDIARLQDREAITVPVDAGAQQLEVELHVADEALLAARREAVELDTEADHRAERRKRVPELLSVAKQRLKEFEHTPPPSDGDSAIAVARRALAALKEAAVRAEIDAYESEVRSYDVRGALLSKRRDRATLRIAYYEALAGKLREAKQDLERLEVERDREATRKLLEELTALPDGLKKTLQDLYQRNEALASLWSSEEGLHAQIDDVSVKLSRAEAKVAELEAELIRLAARAQAVGLADSLGVLLRRHRAEAPDIGMYRRFIRMRQEQIGDVQLQQIKLREQRQALADVDALTNEAMAAIEVPIDPQEKREVESLLRQLFETQRKYMDALIEDYETYFQKLVDFDARQQEVITRTQDLLDFIDERILWIPSGRAVQAELLSDGRDALEWLFGAQYWAQLGRSARDAASRLWPVHLLALLLAILFVPFARRVRSRLRLLGEQATRPDCDHFAPTSQALGLSLLLAIWLPALLAYVGWRLGLSPVATQFTRSVATGLVAAAGFWATLRLARQLVRPDGVAEAHCEWPAHAAHALWRDLRWLTIITVPAVFVIFVFEMRGEDLWRESVGRFAFAISMVAVGVFNYLTLRSRGPFQEVLRGGGTRRPWAWRAARLAAWVIPLALIAAALRGFYWTALQVGIRLHFNLVLLFVLAIVLQLAARWSMIAQRRAAAEDAPHEERPAAPTPTLEVSRLMIGTGFLLALLATSAIWADLLPAAKVLQQVELWTTTETVTVSEPGPAGADRVSTEDQLVVITLADVFQSLLIGLLTVALIRALPGILEATLFRRLGPGERYAYSTIVKYAVVLVGVAVAFDAIGVGWSSIQWLVAAVGLGLGFGLQEIFANFVSGLIILFERPIRVGDTVSVGEVNGTVSRIRIRATWITAFDRKELIVPNKEFVTGRLINWTLSDSVLRTTIPIGVAYGSDTARVMEVLARVAQESWRVLRDPPPQIFFVGFGDSSLSFELRVFIRTVEHLFPVRHELHMNIDEAFREAGIEIAFPQRDLHLRSVPDDWRPPPRRPE
jgi:potassium efflux system protein